MKFRQIGHTTSHYGQSFSLKLLVHGTGLLSLKLRHWLYLDQIETETHVSKANDNNKSTCIIVIKMYIYSMLIGNATIY